MRTSLIADSPRDDRFIVHFIVFMRVDRGKQSWYRSKNTDIIVHLNPAITPWNVYFVRQKGDNSDIWSPRFVARLSIINTLGEVLENYLNCDLYLVKTCFESGVIDYTSLRRPEQGRKQTQTRNIFRPIPSIFRLRKNIRVQSHMIFVWWDGQTQLITVPKITTGGSNDMKITWWIYHISTLDRWKQLKRDFTFLFKYFLDENINIPKT